MGSVRKVIPTDDRFASALQSWSVLSEQSLAKAETEDDKMDLLKTVSAPEHLILFESFRIFTNQNFTKTAVPQLAVPPNEMRQSKKILGSSKCLKKSALLTEGFPLHGGFQ